jgi:hypothetical protein
MEIFANQLQERIKTTFYHGDGAWIDGWRAAVFDLEADDDWRRWRDWKLQKAAAAATMAPVGIADPNALSDGERRALLDQVAAANYALYEWGATPGDVDALDAWLLAFTRAFRLRAVEDHRSANRNGVVRIEVVREGGRVGYIPYTDRRIAWHTDGYYNYHGPSDCVRGMILHCASAAAEGGENRLLDHELAYLRLRDDDPEAVRLLMHGQAMIIPEATDDCGRFRATNAGPVFFLDSSGALAMRYTARKKYVEWRDGDTRAAAERLLALIEAEPLARRVRLAPGQGVLCNNVPHDRSAFQDDGRSPRLLCRIRFHNRIETSEENPWPTSAN